MAWTAPRTWVTSETVTSTVMNTHVRDNLRELWHEMAYVEFTSPVTVSSGVAHGSPTDIVSAGSVTYGGFPIMVEFWAPGLTPAGDTNASLNLWEGATDKGRLVAVPMKVAAPTEAIYLTRRYTPSAGALTIKVSGWATSAAYTVNAGAGGVDITLPGYIRIMEKGNA